MRDHFDTIIIGLGAMGSSTAYQLSKGNQKVLGIDRYNPPHSLGSSHGDTRITRKAICEGEQYIPLALRSYEIWDEISKITRQKLIEITSGLILANKGGNALSHGSSRLLEDSIEFAKTHNINHQVLNSKQIQAQFPQFQLDGSEMGYLELQAGFLRPELCIRAQLEIAKQNGIEIHRNEEVLSITISDQSDKVIVTSTTGVYEAEQIVISAGPWIKHFLTDYQNNFDIYRQVLYWFDLQNKTTNEYRIGRFPIFIWGLGTMDDVFYGFPAIDGVNGGIKIATEEFSQTIDPNYINREVSANEIQAIYNNYIKTRFHGISPKCLRANVCMYTVTTDNHFVIDRHPKHQNMILVSPCSGHGFKHSAAIGEVVAQMASRNSTDIDISSFSLKRFE